MQSNQPGYSEGGVAAPAYQPPQTQQQPAYNPAVMQQPQQQVVYVQQAQAQPQAQPQAQQQVIYVQQQGQIAQPVVVSNPRHMPRHPTTALCAKCQINVETQTRLEDGCGTWLICGGICLAGFWCGCCLIPFCMDDCKDVIHLCSRCGTVVGTRKIVNM